MFSLVCTLSAPLRTFCYVIEVHFSFVLVVEVVCPVHLDGHCAIASSGSLTHCRELLPGGRALHHHLDSNKEGERERERERS